MPYAITQSTTTWPLVFLMVESADHITALTGASPTVTLSKNGGAFASPSGAVSEIANGWYKVAGNATDTNTLGPLILHATAASGDPTDMIFEVVAYGPQTATNLGLSALPTANPGAANGVLIAGTNAATTIDALTLTGTAASGATPATAGLTITGGAASTTGGGTAAPAISATGGAGAASTNGAAAGATFTAGGTTTVSGNDGVKMVGTGNGNGLTLTHAGTGLDLNATTSPPLNVNVTQINAVSTSSVTTVSANQGTTQPLNFTGTGGSALVKSDMTDIAGSAVSTSTAQLGVNVVNIAGTASAGAAGFVGIDWSQVHAPTTTLDLSGTTIKNLDNNPPGYPTNFSSLAITAGGAVTVGTNNDKTGYSLTQTFPTNFSALAITAGGAVTVGTNNDKTGYSLAGNVTVGGYAAGQDPMTLAFQTALTESYAALHAVPTATQLLLELRGHMSEKSITGTTLTINKVNGSTTAEQFLLNDAVSPTSITRSS